MKTIIDNFERWIRAGNGPAMAQQMNNLAIARRQNIVSQYELDQIKLGVIVLSMTVENENLLKSR